MIDLPPLPLDRGTVKASLTLNGPPCPTCHALTRWDGVYLMCDYCKRVIGLRAGNLNCIGE